MKPSDVTGVILAGGQATRMGGIDKGLVRVGGRPMVEHVLERLKPQVATVLINANRSHDAYRAQGVAVVSDDIDGFAGPLAGMAAGLAAASTPYIITVPCDSPLVPEDLVRRMIAAVEREGAAIGVASGAGRLQPVFALLPTRLLGNLRDFLAGGGRKIDRWYAEHPMAVADLSDRAEAFLNVNSPADRDAMEAEFFQRAAGGARDAGQ